MMHGFISDGETDTDVVISALGIRDKAICELRISRAKYDGVKVLKILNHRIEITIDGCRTICKMKTNALWPSTSSTRAASLNQRGVRRRVRGSKSARIIDSQTSMIP